MLSRGNLDGCGGFCHILSYLWQIATSRWRKVAVPVTGGARGAPFGGADLDFDLEAVGLLWLRWHRPRPRASGSGTDCCAQSRPRPFARTVTGSRNALNRQQWTEATTVTGTTDVPPALPEFLHYQA